MSRIPLAEGVGRPQVHPDDAYVAALHGDMGHVGLVEDAYFQRAVLAATQPRQRLPREGDIANAVWRENGITLPELHLLAEILGGRDRITTRATRHTATAIGALTFVPEVLFDLGARVARGPAARTVLQGAATGFALPRIAAEGLARRGMNNAESAAYALVRHLYDAHYYTATDLAPYVWATLMTRLARRPDVEPSVLERLADRFRSSYRASADMRSPEHTPIPLRAMFVYLQDGHSARTAIRIFQDREAEARETRARRLREFFAPPRSTQPSGDVRRRLRESSEEYQFFSTHPYHALEARMQRVAIEVNEGRPGALPEMAAVMSAVIERAQLGQEPARQEFLELLGQYREKYGDQLRDMLISWLPEITAGRAPLGIVRLADSFVRLPNLWFGWAYEGDATQLYRALETAAFDWYEQKRAKYSHNPAVRQMLYAAYINRRTLLGGGTRDLALAKQRAWELLHVLPGGRRARHQVERDVPVVVQGEIAAARQVLKTKAKARG